MYGYRTSDYEMISKAEPCLVVSIQNQLTLCIGTVIVQQIPVARKLKLLFGDCTDARNKIAESLKTKLLYMYCEFRHHYEFFV